MCMKQIMKSLEEQVKPVTKDLLFSEARMRARLNKEQIASLEKLNSFDLSEITAKFSTKYDNIRMVPEQVYMTKVLLGTEITESIPKILESDFKKWIALSIISPGTSFAPISREVDMYWHLFILHTKEYGEFCKTILGRYLGHQPTNEKIRNDVNKSGENTRVLFYELFGVPGIEKLKDSKNLHLIRQNATIEAACDGNPPCSGDGCTGHESCNQGSCKSACSP